MFTTDIQSLHMLRYFRLELSSWVLQTQGRAVRPMSGLNFSLCPSVIHSN